MSDIRTGDRVKFRAGRGTAEGRVVNVADGILSIATRGDKIVNRKASRCERVESIAEVAAETATPTAEEPKEQLAQ